MDQLDQVIGLSYPLLRRVDEVLSVAGAPPEHRLWVELRRVRLLPGDAVHAVVALRSTELLDAPPELRSDARAYVDIADSLPTPDHWTGDAADAYSEARRRVSQHLSGAPDSLDERLEATADLADALIDWITRARASLAATLSAVLGSAEALALTSDIPLDLTDPAQIQAAADIAERVLRTVATSYDQAAELLHASADLAKTGSR